MEGIKKYKEQFLFHIVLNIIIGTMISFSSYVHLPLSGVKDYMFYGVHFLLLQFTIFGFLYWLSLFRKVFYVVFPVLFLFFSVAGFYVYSQDVTISQNLIQVVAETKPDIVIELISLPVLLYIVLVLVILFYSLKKYNQLTVNNIKSPLTVLALLATVTYWGVEQYRDGTFERRLPYNFFVATYDYLMQPTLKIIPSKPNEISTDSLNVVLIIGESVRADHLYLNGYQRNTTPLLSQINNLISFSKTYTPHTFTAASIQQMLSNATVDDDLSVPKYSLVDVLNNAKVKTNWIGNQTPEKSYNVFIEECQKHIIHDPMRSEINFKKALDTEMLPMIYQNFLPHTNQLMIIHSMGSHWYYENRYSDNFRKFLPVTQSKNVSSNSSESIINSYDNSILLMDYFVSELIHFLEKTDSNSLLIYLSDHGEVLGEDGKWLHAQEHDAAKHPAMFIWYSDTFSRTNSSYINAMKKKRNQTVKLDFLYPTLLQLYGFETENYNKNSSILN